MLPIPHRPVSGRYRGRHRGFEVELRVDVDGGRPMNRISADYFRIHRDEPVYFGSMCVDAPTLANDASGLTITGVVRATWQTEATNVRVVIRRGLRGAQPASATLSHFTASGRLRASYECAYTSARFRTVLLEEDGERGVRCFESYETGSLPAPCSPRTLTHLSAFEEAGIEMVRTRERGVIDSPGAAWSDAELQAAMVKHFAAFGDKPNWAIWLLHARLHDRDRTSSGGSVVGMMFDRRGLQRQGCAVFYRAMAEMGLQGLRTQLFACVHELAHGFNLLHSFQKSLAIPPVPSRPSSATWMAYPHLFPGGAEAFWSQFDFRFDDEEVVHLRHAYRADIIMGGNPFMAGAAFEEDTETAATQAEDPGLRLALRAPRVFPHGVPVTVELMLSGTTREGRPASTVLGPRAVNVDIAIRGPQGSARVFEPLLRHCRVGDTICLHAGDAPVRDSAFIHYGKDGFAFHRPGRYEITARYVAPNGELVQSNVAQIVIRPPTTRADKDVARLVFDKQQGELISLVGSDAPELRGGNEALQAIIDRHPQHPVASVARLVRATNAAREFKIMRLDGSVRVRKPDPQEAVSILGASGLRTLQRAAASAADGPLRPRTSSRAPTDGTASAALHQYLRSRLNEISLVVPEVLATGPVARAGRRSRAR